MEIIFYFGTGFLIGYLTGMMTLLIIAVKITKNTDDKKSVNIPPLHFNCKSENRIDYEN